VATCCGRASAISWATAEPSDQPMTCAFGISRASSRADASSAMDAAVMSPSPRSLPPSPRLSKAMTRYRWASRGTFSAHSPIAPDVPMTSRSGSPSPVIS